MMWIHEHVATIFGIVRIELRERPVRFVSTMLFILVTALLMPYAERHGDIPVASQNETAIANITAAVGHVQCIPGTTLPCGLAVAARPLPDAWVCSRDENKSADSHLARLRPR
jgi:hypothetical protein